MKHFFRDYFLVLSLGAVLLTGCSTEQEVVTSEGDTSQGKITFSFPFSKETTTYSTVAATSNESYLDVSNITIFMVDASDMVEAVFSGTGTNGIVTSTSGTSQTATITIKGKEVSSAKTFYFVANTSGITSALSSIVAGSSSLSDLLKLTTGVQSAHLSSVNGFLLTGSVTVSVDDLTSLTPASISVTLKRRVARFDISNNVTDTGITIDEIYFTKAHQTALIFADKDSLPKTKANLPLLSFLPFANANMGVSESVFYLYPSDSVFIQLRGTVGDGSGGVVTRLYNIPLPKGGILANKRYTLKANPGPYTAFFDLMVADWIDNGDVSISTANTLEIIKSTPSGHYPAGWNSKTLRYDVLHNTNITTPTIIELEVSTLTEKGVVVDVKDNNLGYGIITATGTVDPVFTQGNNSVSYIQKVIITLPAYTSTAAIEAKVLIKDAYDSQYKTVIITREDYFPAKHKGWAGCNIYYDTTKGHLTFDDVDDVTHSAYQGVYFQWGSLWGISPKDSWSGNVVLYPPMGGTTTANAEGFVIWDKDIPRIPDNLFTPAIGKDRRDWAYAYQATDSAKGVGDICKHLTDKGWAPGNATGKKWRLPTSREFEGTYDWSGGTPDLTNTEGTNMIHAGCFLTKLSPKKDAFFPASGSRDYNTGVLGNVGTYGQYYSGSSYSYSLGTGVYTLGFDSSSVNPVGSGARATGRSVRCVAEN